MSWLREDQVRESVRAADALLYAIVAPPPGLPDSLRLDSGGFVLLREVAAATGGRVVTIRSDCGLENAFDEILRDLRIRYVLAFTPDPGREGFVPDRGSGETPAACRSEPAPATPRAPEEEPSEPDDSTPLS